MDNSSRSVNIKGDLTGSVLNLGGISGNVETTISQVPDRTSSLEETPEFLLAQLRTIIKDSTDLSVGEKTVLLEQIEVLVEAKKITDPDRKLELLKKVKGIFEATLEALPDTAKLAESVSTLLPILLKTVGLSV